MDANKLKKQKDMSKNTRLFDAKSKTEKENMRMLKNYLDNMYFA